MGTMVGDILTIESDIQKGTALIHPVMRNGRRISPVEPLVDIRARCADELAHLPTGLRWLKPTDTYKVSVAPALERLAADVDRRLDSRH